MNVCPKCGRLLAEGTLLCPADGTPILLPAPQAPIDEPAPDANWEQTVIRDLMVGRHIGDYIVRRRIGNGGMGIVYEAHHPEIGRRVAIKVLRPELAGGAARGGLLAEARAANAIRHRGIIDIFGFGQLDGVGQYIVMDFLDGQPLDGVIGEKTVFAATEGAAILLDVLGALDAAHAVGVVHRDLKPSNIFLARESAGTTCVKVLDFGLAKMIDPGDATRGTRGSVVVGTPEYMAPEQAKGQRVGPPADLYAVGCLAFEMFTGRIPFEGDGPMAIAVRQVNDAPERPSKVRPGLPAELDAWILKLMEKDPGDRYASAAEARAALERCLERWKRDDDKTVVRRALSREAPTQQSGPPSTMQQAPVAEVERTQVTKAPSALELDLPRRHRRVLPWVVAAALGMVGVGAGLQLSRPDARVEPVAPTPVAPTPVAPMPVAPMPVAPTPVAPMPVAPTPVAPMPVAPVRASADPEPVAEAPAPQLEVAPVEKPKPSGTRPAPAPPREGTLVVRIPKSWADVEVDGKLVKAGAQRFYKVQLRPGAHKVKVKGPLGEHEWSVQISSGRESEVIFQPH